MTECPICGKDITNPNSMKHINSKLHQEALEKEYENMKPAEKEEEVVKKTPVLIDRGQKKIDGFHIKFNDVKSFKNITDTLKEIIDETIIKVSPKSVLIQAIDASRICMLQVEFKREDFDYYNCSKTYDVAINLIDLDKIMKRAVDSDEMDFISDKKDQKLKIIFKRDGGRKRTFSLYEIELEYEELSFENLFMLEYPVSFTMDTSLFEIILKDAEIYAEAIDLKAIDDSKFIFSASGAIGEMEAELEEDDFISLTVIEKAIGCYSISFLKALMKLNPVVEEFKVSFSEEYPLKIEYKLKDNSELAYFIGPRVDQGDNEEAEEDYEEDSPEELENEF